jgi:hypothetical protein
MSHSNQYLSVPLNLETTRKLERMAQERGESPEALAAILIENLIIRKISDNSIRLIRDEDRDCGCPDPKSLAEIIKRQDDEIAWLRQEINRMITRQSEIHIIHHGQGEITFKKPQTKEKQPDNQEQKKAPAHVTNEVNYYQEPPRINADFAGETFSQIALSSSDPSELIPPETASEKENTQQISGKTLRNLVGGITGEKNYTAFEAAAIAGEPEAVILEYINDGFLPATKYLDTYLIRGNDLRQYIMSK